MGAPIAARLRRIIIIDEVRSDNPLPRDAADLIDEMLAALKGVVGVGTHHIEVHNAALAAIAKAEAR